ncbi:MAG: LPS translocon maturation chaperone LptM [Gammaproteobacteria bacterium]
MFQNKIILLTLMSYLLIGCGQKGPLYLPDNYGQKNVQNQTQVTGQHS